MTAKQVIRKMKTQRMYPMGFASDKGIFEDGTRVSHKVILNLLRTGEINRPGGTSIHSPFTLTK